MTFLTDASADSVMIRVANNCNAIGRVVTGKSPLDELIRACNYLGGFG